MARNWSWKKIVGALVALVVVVLVIIQLIPLNMDNPKTVSEPNWDSPRTRELAKAACFDCHSNETVWPWYAKVGPARLLLYNDVKGGREHLNFSDWNASGREADDVAEAINGGEMPPWYYTIMHSSAKLSDSEKQELVSGLEKTMSGSASLSESGESDKD